MEPPVRVDRLGSLFGVLVVTFEDVGALEADLPPREGLIGGQVVHLWDIDKFYLGAKALIIIFQNHTLGWEARHGPLYFHQASSRPQRLQSL